MGKPTFLLFLLVLLFNSAYSQSQKTKKDFNKDGVLDQVTITEDGGSSFSTKDIQYIDGKTKKKYSFWVEDSFGSFFSVCNIPNAINKSARESLGNLIFGRKDSIDPSLNWLIDVSSSEDLKYNPIWISGEPEIPDGYFAILEGKKYKEFLKNIQGSPDSGEVEPNYLWIDYNTYGHHFMEINREEDIPKGDFKISKIDSSTWVYNTAHGVILKKGNKYSWVFISDNKVIEAYEKFRFASIQDVKMINEYVIVLHTPSGVTNDLYIVDPITGYIISLDNEEIGFNPINNIKVGKHIVELIGSEGEKYSLTLGKINELFKEVSEN